MTRFQIKMLIAIFDFDVRKGLKRTNQIENQLNFIMFTRVQKLEDYIETQRREYNL